MHISTLNHEFVISGQLTVEDLGELQAHGIKTVFCHRLDAEEPGQPTEAELRDAAEALGIAFHSLPFAPDKLLPHTVAEFRRIYAAASKPVLGFCRSGKRAETIWRLAGQLKD